MSTDDPEIKTMIDQLHLQVGEIQSLVKMIDKTVEALEQKVTRKDER